MLADRERVANEISSALTLTQHQLEDTGNRVVELENAHEKSTGIKVRVDNTVTLAQFSKMEMCLLQGVLKQYMGQIKNMDDIKFAMDLYNRMTGIIQGMRE